MKNKRKYKAFYWIRINRLYSFIFFVFLIIMFLTVSLNIINLCKNVNETFNKWKILVDDFFVIISFIFAYLLANHNSKKEERVKNIKEYYKDLEEFKNKILFIKKEVKKEDFIGKELIYTYKEICKHVNKITDNFQKEKIELFLLDSWKISTQFYKETSTFFKKFTQYYFYFKESITILKNTNFFTDKEIDDFIELFLNSEQDENSFEIFYKKADIPNNEMMKIIYHTCTFINLLRNAFIDILVIKSIDFTNEVAKEIEKRKTDYLEKIEICYDHEHFWNIKKNKCFCSVTIYQTEKIINKKLKSNQ